MRWTRPFFSSRKTRLFGLDINSNAVSLLVLARSGEQYFVQAYGQERLPDQVIKGHDVQDITALAYSIQTLLHKLDLNDRTHWELQAAIAVPDACTLHKIIQVSERLQEADLEKLVSMELTKCIPESLTDIYYDFKQVGNAQQSGMKDMLIVAARAKYIKDRVSALRSIDLNTNIVEVESLALQRIISFCISKETKREINVILDLGYSLLKVFFFRQETLIFVYEEELTSSLEQESSYLEEILLRFKRACHFLSAKYVQNDSLDQIILSGPGAKNPKNRQGLQQYYNCPILCANPFIHIQTAEGLNAQQLFSDAPLYLTAFGLAKRVC